MKNFNLKPYIFILSSFILVTSCSKDDEVEYITQTITETVVQTVTETVTITAITVAVTAQKVVQRGGPGADMTTNV